MPLPVWVNEPCGVEEEPGTSQQTTHALLGMMSHTPPFNWANDRMKKKV